MTSPTLDELIAAYVAALESGTEPERERWIADYNEHAENLREFFADLDRLRAVVQGADERTRGQTTGVEATPSSLQDEDLQRLTRLLRTTPSATGGASTAPTLGLSNSELSPSTTIDRYKLLQRLGTGGMGEVWMAEQEKPVRRRVALKLIKAGMDSRQVVARFEAERQALALMDHQNIAKVFDAGTAADGRPYFVMELVQGIPITNYCDDNQLGIAARLKLFTAVCEAVQHAHHKGIIHRDLKPSNILVTLYDGRPVPKVIDFGLAKALQTHAALTDQTLFTEHGQVVGTLLYMSPEQAEANGLDADTRTDIFSLGVVLYELLTGATPIERETLKRQAWLTALQTVRDQETIRPSARLSSSQQRLQAASQLRSVHPKRLTQMLAGDLDWIVLKALERERKRRYESAAAFAQDVELFLAGLPVAARPPSVAYQCRKYAIKHRGWVASLSAIVLVVMLGLAGMTYFAVGQQAARHQAEQRGDLLQSQVELLSQVFDEINPAEDDGSDQALRQRLAENLQIALEQVRQRALSGQADLELEGPLLLSLARSLLALGYSQVALDALSSVRPRFEGPDEKMIDLALEIDCHVVGSEHNQGRAAQAIAPLRQIVERMQQRYGALDPRTLRAKSSLALTLSQDHQTAEAVAVYDELLAQYQDLPELAKERIEALHDSVPAYRDAGQQQRAIQNLEQSLEISRTVYGENHLFTVSILRRLGVQYANLPESIDQAKTTLELACTRLIEHHGRWHSTTCLGLMELLVHCTKYKNQAGYAARAEELLPQVEESYRYLVKNQGPTDASTLVTLGNLASALGLMGRMDQCVALHEERVALFRTHYGDEHRSTQAAISALAVALCTQGNIAKAIELISEHADWAQKTLGKDDDITKEAVALRNLWRWKLGAQSLLGF